MENVDSTPLENALRAINKILEQSESDPRVMREMLWDIKDTAEGALLEYRRNKQAALEAENNRLRDELKK